VRERLYGSGTDDTLNGQELRVEIEKLVADGVQLNMDDIQVTELRNDMVAIRSIDVIDQSFEESQFTDGEWHYGGTDELAQNAWDFTLASAILNPYAHLYGTGQTHGENIAIMGSGTISQTLDAAFEVGVSYGFTAELGSKLPTGTADYALSIYAGSTLIGQKTGTTESPGTWTSDEVLAASFDESLLGQAIRIEIEKTGGTQLHVDNVAAFEFQSHATDDFDFI